MTTYKLIRTNKREKIRSISFTDLLETKRSRNCRNNTLLERINSILKDIDISGKYTYRFSL